MSAMMRNVQATGLENTLLKENKYGFTTQKNTEASQKLCGHKSNQNDEELEQKLRRKITCCRTNLKSRWRRLLLLKSMQLKSLQ